MMGDENCFIFGQAGKFHNLLCWKHEDDLLSAFSQGRGKKLLLFFCMDEYYGRHLLGADGVCHTHTQLGVGIGFNYSNWRSSNVMDIR